MMPKSELGTATGLSVYGFLGYASSYLEPALQFALLIVVLVGAVLLTYGRWVDARNKRLDTRIKLHQLKDLEGAEGYGTVARRDRGAVFREACGK